MLIINTNIILDVLGLLFTALTTYLITRYSTVSPRKLEVQQKQLDHVYTPLYKLIRKDIGRYILKTDAKIYSKEISKNLEENFEYAFPQLHDLSDSFVEAVNNDDDKYQLIFDKISYQINIDYMSLRKSLGYPSYSAFQIFKRMSLKDKLSSILGWIVTLLIISIAPIFVLVDKYFPNVQFVDFLSASIFILLSLLTINSLINAMRTHKKY